MGYIYKIVNDINDKIYIGKTIYSLSERWSKHKYAYLYEDWHLYRAMRKYGIEHFQILPLEECDDNELNLREKYYIKKYNSIKDGYNMTEGGDGRTTINREKVREYWEKGLSLSEIASKMNSHYSNISDILKSLKIYDKDEIEKRRKILIANKQSQGKVFQYNEKGIKISEFSSLAEAGVKNNIRKDGIAYACAHQTGYKGYFWVREGDPLPNFRKIKQDGPHAVVQFTLDNKFIKIYNTRIDAARSVGKSDGSCINKCCQGKQKTAYGYIWKNLEDCEDNIYE